MIRVVCGCGRVFKAEDRHAGRRTRCPVCGAVLTIGQMPASNSSGGDLDELPSWWYPSATAGPAGPLPVGATAKATTEGVRTVVLEKGAVAGPGHEAGAGSPDEPAGDGTGPVPRDGSSRAAMAAVAAAAILAVGSLWWWAAGPRPGPAPQPITPRPGPAAGIREVTAPPPPTPATPEGAIQDDPGPGPGPFSAGPPAVATARVPSPPSRRLRLLVPAYIYPNPDGREQWTRLIEAAQRVEVVAVVNPSNGPGTEPNPDYGPVLAEASERGVKLIGYVATRYGDRPAAEVKADIDAWIRIYPEIRGIFLDQQPRDSKHVSYVAEITAHARERMREALVVTSPGNPCDPLYLARRASDLACVFASNGDFARFQLPEELRVYGPSRFAALAYEVKDTSAMRSWLRRAVEKGIGYVYATDGKGANPWERLPGYWEAEVDAVAAFNAGGRVPPR